MTRAIAPATKSTRSRQDQALRATTQALGRLRSRVQRLLDSHTASSCEADLRELDDCIAQQKRIQMAMTAARIEPILLVDRTEEIAELIALARKNIRKPRKPRAASATKRGCTQVAASAGKSQEESVRRFLANLTRRLEALRSSVYQESIEKTELELKKCLAVAGNIGELLRYQQLDRNAFFEELQRTQELVEDINHEISKRRNVWWRRALEFFREHFVTLLKPVLQLLGAPTAPKLLPYHKD